MYLLGYHGTSAKAAAGLTTFGPKKSQAYAALGAGLYVARDCDFLVRFFSTVAIRRDSNMFAGYSQEENEIDEEISLPDGSIVLKIFSRVPLQKLKNCRWDIMDISQAGISPRDNLQDLSGMANNLQMVIPEEYFCHIRAFYCNAQTNINERPVPWPINEWPGVKSGRNKILRKRRNSL